MSLYIASLLYIKTREISSLLLRLVTVGTTVLKIILNPNLLYFSTTVYYTIDIFSYKHPYIIFKIKDKLSLLQDSV